MSIEEQLETCSMYARGHDVARRASRMVANAMWRMFGARPVSGTKGQVTFPDRSIVCIEVICSRRPSMTMSLRGRPTLYRGLSLERMFVAPRRGCTRLRITSQADMTMPLIAFLRAALIVSGQDDWRSPYGAIQRLSARKAERP